MLFQHYALPNAPYLLKARLVDPLLLVLLLVDEATKHRCPVVYYRTNTVSQQDVQLFFPHILLHVGVELTDDFILVDIIVFLRDELEVGALFSSGPLLVERFVESVD